MNVLIAEDDAALRLTVKDILEGANYTVLEVGDGEEALEVLKRGNIDLLLLDLNMPKLSGLEVMDEIKSQPPVIIVVSAYESFNEGELKKAVGPNVVAYLRKPFPPQKLLEFVADVEATLARQVDDGAAGQV
jgi:CheY-like chemotaxis protein